MTHDGIFSPAVAKINQESPKTEKDLRENKKGSRDRSRSRSRRDNHDNHESSRSSKERSRGHRSHRESHNKIRPPFLNIS